MSPYNFFVLVEEGFFSQNWLYIGKTYYSLKKKEEAKVWLQKAAGIAGDNQDDKEVGNITGTCIYNTLHVHVIIHAVVYKWLPITHTIIINFFSRLKQKLQNC